MISCRALTGYLFGDSSKVEEEPAETSCSSDWTASLVDSEVCLQVPILNEEGQVRSEKDDWVKSEIFTIGDFDWRMNGIVDENRLHVCIECNPDNHSNLWVCKVSCKVRMVKKNADPESFTLTGNLCREGEWFMRYPFNEAWTRMIKDASLVKRGHITIIATISINKEAGFRAFRPFDFSKASEYTDGRLKINGRTFHFNKSILYLQSTAFRNLFTGSLSEEQKKNVARYIDEEEFEQFLNIVYPSDYPITEKNYKAMLNLGKLFEVNKVLKLCEDFLCLDFMCTSIESLKLADKYGLPRVVTACVETLDDIAAVEQFTKKPGFDSLSNTTKMEFYQKLITYE